METYYEILGLSRKPTRDELASAYLSLSCECHPDHDSTNDARNERFRLVGEAFCVLYDTKMRFRYDKYLASDPENELGRRMPVALEHARSLFREMAVKFVEAGLDDDDDPNDVLQNLLAMKCPPELAETTVRVRTAQLRQEIRTAGLKTLALALMVFLPGAALTFYSFATSRTGSFWLWYGPIIIGGFYLLYALHCLATGKRPQYGNPMHYFLGMDETNAKRR